VDGRKNLKLKKSSEYVTSSVEESTMEIEVNANNFSRKDEVDLYVLEVVPNHKKNVHLLMRFVKDEREITKAISPILLGNGLTNKEINEFQFLLHKYHHLFAMSYKDLKKVALEEHKIELLSITKLLR
jgi:hypothetical protein